MWKGHLCGKQNSISARLLLLKNKVSFLSMDLDAYKLLLVLVEMYFEPCIEYLGAGQVLRP